MTPLPPFVHENMVWRDRFGRPVPCLARSFSTLTLNLVHLLTTGFSSFAFRNGLCLNRQVPSGQSRIHRVTQLLTDSVHHRKSAGAGSVVLNLARVTNVACSENPIIDQLMCAIFSHTPTNGGVYHCLKKNQNAPRPSEHPPVMGEKCQNV